MKKIIVGILIFSFLFCGTFYLASFFIPRTIIAEPLQNSFFDSSEINTLINSASLAFQTDNNEEEKEPLYLKTIADARDDFISAQKSFLEINISQMKVRLYEDGSLAKEVPILAKGDPQSWGGTSAGSYKALSKYRAAFSVIGEVYMPYSIHFYGKYYLHGEPYYSGGRKFVSEISGGCIRLLDKDAEDIYGLVKKDLPILVIDKENKKYKYFAKKADEMPAVSAESYLVADLDSGFVFAQKNSEEVLPVASLTKLMTAVILAENVDLRKSIFIQDKMLNAYGSAEELISGRRLRVIELLYPLLIESSNDAAEVLACFLGRDKTITLMNEKTEAILMEKTNFVDPSGFDSKNVSTAKDLFHLARYILNNRPLLLEITKGEKVLSFGDINLEIENLWNKNIFIQDTSFIGGKTGHIEESENTALFIFQFFTDNEEPRNIAIILLTSENSKTDTQKIYQWLQENYSLSLAP